MTSKNSLSDIPSSVVVVYKQSRFAYTMEQASNREKQKLSSQSDPLAAAMIRAHHHNASCLRKVESTLVELGISYRVICRSEMHASTIENCLIISVGGDGTLLDASHHSKNSPILGVNSDPSSSVGALCAAYETNFRDVMEEIYKKSFKPCSFARLTVSIDNVPVKTQALNDILFCHKCPATTSRFFLTSGHITESHRSSGIWVATSAGSTGGIFSAGADALPFGFDGAIFRMREPCWTHDEIPRLLAGSFKKDERLLIRSNMTGGQIFIDGPHITADIELGARVEISLSDRPLWIFAGPRVERIRKRIVNQRALVKRSGNWLPL